MQSGKYLTGLPASWSEGDWNGDGVFDQRDISAALTTGRYVGASLRAVRPLDHRDDRPNRSYNSCAEALVRNGRGWTAAKS